MAGTAIAVAAITAAATTVATGVANYVQGQNAANAAKSLENQQNAQLQQESEQAAALAAQEATTGQTFAFGSEPTSASIMTGLGFGQASAGSRSPNAARAGEITGMG